MKTFFFLVLSVFNCTLVMSQIKTDFHPINKTFKKIVFADFPEPDEKRRGIVFYNLDTAFYNRFISERVLLISALTASDYTNFKFKGKKFRFAEYNAMVDSITYIRRKDRQKLLVEAKLKITANAYKKKFDFLRFRHRLVLKDTVLLYYGSVGLEDSFESTSDQLVKRVLTIIRHASLTCTQGERYNLLLEPNKEKFNNIARCDINFDDAILRDNKIADFKQSDFYVVSDIEDSGSILIYFIARQ